MNLRSLGRYVRDGSVPRWRRAMVLFGLVYTVFPLDVIPDVLPVIGWLDDVGVMGAAIAFLVRDVKRHALANPADPTTVA